VVASAHAIAVLPLAAFAPTATPLAGMTHLSHLSPLRAGKLPQIAHGSSALPDLLSTSTNSQTAKRRPYSSVGVGISN